VLASATTGAAGVLVKVDDLDAGGNALAGAGLAVERVGEQLRVTIDPARGSEVTRVLAESGQWVSELRPVEHRLEDVFLQLTGEPRDEAS
jgi:hypothetical protein